MKHGRYDYNRFQDPALADPSLLAPGCTPIGEDEPVMLFRAQDGFMPAVLSVYLAALIVHGAPDNMIRAIVQHIESVRLWQSEHDLKMPDLPDSP